MGMFTALNKNFESPFIGAKDFDDVSFVNLEEIYKNYGDLPFLIRGFWLNPKSKYGTHGVAMIEIMSDNGELERYNLSLPAHCNESIETILATPDYINGINADKCVAKIVKYTAKKYNRECYTIQFIDAE